MIGFITNGRGRCGCIKSVCGNINPSFFLRTFHDSITPFWMAINIIAFPLLNPHLRWFHPMRKFCVHPPCFVLFDARFLLTLLAPLIHRFLTASDLFPPNGGGPKKIGVPLNSFYTIQKFTI